jgi:hypothetical protein
MTTMMPQLGLRGENGEGGNDDDEGAGDLEVVLVLGYFITSSTHISVIIA